jgi:hypothetical protein
MSLGYFFFLADSVMELIKWLAVSYFSNALFIPLLEIGNSDD